MASRGPHGTEKRRRSKELRGDAADSGQPISDMFPENLRYPRFRRPPAGAERFGPGPAMPAFATRPRGMAGPDSLEPGGGRSALRRSALPFEADSRRSSASKPANSDGFKDPAAWQRRPPPTLSGMSCPVFRRECREISRSRPESPNRSPGARLRQDVSRSGCPGQACAAFGSCPRSRRESALPTFRGTGPRLPDGAPGPFGPTRRSGQLDWNPVVHADRRPASSFPAGFHPGLASEPRPAGRRKKSTSETRPPDSPVFRSRRTCAMPLPGTVFGAGRGARNPGKSALIAQLSPRFFKWISRQRNSETEHA